MKGLNSDNMMAQMKNKREALEEQWHTQTTWWNSTTYNSLV